MGTPGKPTHNKNWLLITNTKIRPGADCDSDNEFLIAEFRLNLKKVRKTTRPFRYDLNKIPYDYIVASRFRGLELVDRVCAQRTMEGGS